jgi:hypothetical protein
VNYGVKIVEDDALPEEHEWAFVKTDDGLLLVMTRTAVNDERTLEECWSAYRSIEGCPCNIEGCLRQPQATLSGIPSQRMRQAVLDGINYYA